MLKLKRKEVLSHEQTIKEQQLAAANIDLLVKQAQLQLVLKDIELKNVKIHEKAYAECKTNLRK